MEALTVRGLQDKDTIEPENRKSETEDGNSKSCSRRNLSKDCDGGSDPKRQTQSSQRTENQRLEIVNRRHDQARGQEIRERGNRKPKTET